MNQLKAYFVTLYVGVAGATALIALFQLARNGVSYGWVGALMAVVPFLGFFAWTIWINKRTLTAGKRLPVLSLFTLSGVALSAYGFLGPGQEPGGGLLAAVIAALGFFLYTNWYSFLGRRVSPVLVRGSSLPDLLFEDLHGQQVHSSALLGSPALLLFYRGNWCPICVAQVADVARRYRELNQRGVKIAMVSPQPHDLTRRVADAYDINVNFWVDVDGRAAKVLEIYQENGVPVNARGAYGSDTVLPTAIIVDGNGKILYVDQTENYRIRPNPDVFLEVLSAQGY